MNHFFAYINRMKHINRWGLMKNTEMENLSEHSFQTAILSHALAVIERDNFNSEIDPYRTAVKALYHDVSEIITGDMPTPVKYFNEEITVSYKKIEKRSKDALIEKLPDGMKNEFSDIINAEESPEWAIVKAADTLSAYIKCIEEIKAGNPEFSGAGKTIKAKLENMNLKCLNYFMDEFLPSYYLNIDELK